jgi:hypothetical protein
MTPIVLIKGPSTPCTCRPGVIKPEKNWLAAVHQGPKAGLRILGYRGT